ncbi:MAG TPA: hypothetical protein VHP38_16370, partial [Ruminiclostridium sp.]|nr:hypothetical protein [Ruminiclostridium sp.]
RSAVWGRDKGFYEYELELGYGLDPEKLQNGRIIFEAAARKHANAVNMACENCTGAELQVYINKSAIGTVYPEDDPLNEKALFTHATLSNGKYLYKNQGNLGYGYRYELQIPADVLNEIKQNQRLHIRFEAAKGGMTLYGSRVGRYGINPLVVFEYHT